MAEDLVGTQVGDYRVEQMLASGHSTEIVRASHVTLGRQVVIKILKPSLDPTSSFGRALQREAEILGRFRHQNIPRLLHFEHSDGKMWLATDYTEGFTLRRVIDAGAPLDPLVVIAIAWQLADALVHVHELGIVHGDVQPSNILIGVDGSVLLLDFGRAQIAGKQPDQLPASEPVLGSSERYSSPEQILGHPLDGRSDMFSLGVVMFEMLTAKPPFEASEQQTLASAIRHEVPPAVHKLVAQVPRALDRLVATCLNKAASDRYSSLAVVRARLRQQWSTHSEAQLRRLIILALVKTRLLERPPSTDPEPDPEPAATASTSAVSLKPALWLNVGLLAAAIVGALGVHWTFRRQIEAQAAVKRGPLRLVPRTPGYLRVLARPWAHVLVDGQQVETTPFFKPIPLEPGIHYVTLRHPAAPDERRIVRVASGEFVTLDVTMQVKPVPVTSASALRPKHPAPVTSASSKSRQGHRSTMEDIR